MPGIDTNKVLSGILNALRTAYPESKIETEINDSTGGDHEFVVLLISGIQTEHTVKRKRRLLNFDIRYMPKPSAEEHSVMADKLCDAFDVITIQEGIKMKGGDIHFEVDDKNVLHFYVSYVCLVQAIGDEPAMESMKLKQTGI